MKLIMGKILIIPYFLYELGSINALRIFIENNFLIGHLAPISMNIIFVAYIQVLIEIQERVKIQNLKE